MSIKLVDSLQSMGNFPVAYAEAIECADGTNLEAKIATLGGSTFSTITQKEYDELDDQTRIENDYLCYDTGNLYYKGVNYGKVTDKTLDADSLNAISNSAVTAGLQKVQKSCRGITTLSALELEASATLQDVLSAMQQGQFAILNVSEFTNYKTIFPYEEKSDDYASVFIIKSSSNTRDYIKWFRTDGAKEAIATISSGGTPIKWTYSYKKLRDGNMDDGTISITGENVNENIADGVLPETLGFSKDVMTWDTGIYRISHGQSLTNTPDNLQAGRLEHLNLKRWGSNHNPNTNTWAERFSIWYAVNGSIYTRVTTSGATSGVTVTDTGWRKLSQDKYSKVTNSQYYKLVIKKRNPAWFGYVKFEYVHGITPCEVVISIQTSGVSYSVTKGTNAVEAITYTFDDSNNATIGIKFKAKIYGTETVTLPSEFATLSEFTQDEFTGDQTATLVQNLPQTYETSEVVIGKWVNGKTLYRKCFSVSDISDSTGIIPLDTLPNVSVIKFGGTFQTGGNTFPLPYGTVVNSEYCIPTYQADNGQFALKFSQGSMTILGYNAYIEYVKE